MESNDISMCYCNDIKLLSNTSVVITKLSNQEIRKFDQKFYETHCKTVHDIQVDKELFAKTLGLISNKKLSEESTLKLKETFPLRRIARIEPKLNSLDQQFCVSEIIINKNRKKKIIKRFTKKSVRNRCQPKNGFVSSEFKSISFPICSKLFTIFESKLTKPLSDEELTKVSDLSVQPPAYCMNKDLLNSKQINKYNDWNTKDIEKKCHKSELSVRMCDPEVATKKRKTKTSDQFVHWITFSRRQRLDKMARMTSGLKWKLRLKASSCNKLEIKLKKIPVVKCWTCCQLYAESNLCHHLSARRTESNAENEVIDRNQNDKLMTSSAKKSIDINDKELDYLTRITLRNESVLELIDSTVKRVFAEINDNSRIGFPIKKFCK